MPTASFERQGWVGDVPSGQQYLTDINNMCDTFVSIILCGVSVTHAEMQ